MHQQPIQQIPLQPLNQDPMLNQNPILSQPTIEPQMVNDGWIGVALDGTIAHYDHFRGSAHIGDPVPEMLAFVNKMLEEGKDVRLFTARVSPITLMANAASEKEAQIELESVITAIYKWMVEHLMRPIPITCTKDNQMICLYDDRCIQIISNTGKRADGQPL